MAAVVLRDGRRRLYRFLWLQLRDADPPAVRAGAGGDRGLASGAGQWADAGHRAAAGGVLLAAVGAGGGPIWPQADGAARHAGDGGGDAADGAGLAGVAA